MSDAILERRQHPAALQNALVVWRCIVYHRGPVDRGKTEAAHVSACMCSINR